MVHFNNALLIVLISCSVLMLYGFSLAAGAEEKPQSANPVVLMTTSEGVIKIELWPDKAPETVKNFLAYVDEGFYDGTIFHRVIGNFMIQ